MSWFSKLFRKFQPAQIHTQPTKENNFPDTVEIASHSDPGKTYTVNLAETTCTCPDWQKWRKNAHISSRQRLCKHLYEAFDSYPQARPKVDISSTYIADEDEWREQWQGEMELAFGNNWKRKEKEIRKLFGDKPQCLYNWKMYRSRLQRKKPPVHLLITPTDNYRPRFDFLASTGAIRKAEFSNGDLLNRLTIPELQQLIKKLEITVPQGAKKADYVKALTHAPEIRDQLNPDQRIDLQDTWFLLESIPGMH